MLSGLEIQKMQAELVAQCEGIGVHALEAAVHALGHNDSRQVQFAAMMLCLHAGQRIAKELGMLEVYRTMCNDIVAQGHQRNTGLEN